MWGYMENMMGYGSGWGYAGAVHMLLWWGLIILAIAVLAKWLVGKTGRSRSAGDRPLEILRERYARGEIDKNEYETRKRDLTY